MDFAEPLAVAFAPGQPGIVAATISGATVYGVLGPDVDDVLGLAARQSTPAFTCLAADLPALNKGDTATISGAAYTVRDWRRDAFDPIAVLYLNNPAT